MGQILTLKFYVIIDLTACFLNCKVGGKVFASAARGQQDDKRRTQGSHRRTPRGQKEDTWFASVAKGQEEDKRGARAGHRVQGRQRLWRVCVFLSKNPNSKLFGELI